jgi:hypothetical protein
VDIWHTINFCDRICINVVIDSKNIDQSTLYNYPGNSLVPGFVAVMYFGTNHVKPATFLIPKDFRGKIIIYYGEPCGEKF